MKELIASSFLAPLPAGPAICPSPGLASRRTSYQETAQLARQGTISLVTAEGDRVTISADWSSGYSLGFGQAQRGGVLLAGYSLSTLEQHSYSITVQGDLNEEELADITRLLDKLTAIAYDFFNGDQEKAVQGALLLGEMGTVSELSATFMQSAISSQRLVSQGPPAGSYAAARAPLPEVSEVYRYHDIVQAQWQQLKEWLAAETAAAGRPEPATSGGSRPEPPPSERMLAALKETMARHPRLIPLSRGLAETAVQRAAARFAAGHPGLSAPRPAGPELLQRLGERLDDWLLSA